MNYDLKYELWWLIHAGACMCAWIIDHACASGQKHAWQGTLYQDTKPRYKTFLYSKSVSCGVWHVCVLLTVHPNLNFYLPSRADNLKLGCEKAPRYDIRKSDWLFSDILFNIHAWVTCLVWPLLFERNNLTAKTKNICTYLNTLYEMCWKFLIGFIILWI